MRDSAEQELCEVTAQWDRAMVENDARSIGEFMTDDWVIVGPDGSVGGKERFLGLVESGDLNHNVMETHDMEVRVYGDTAVAVTLLVFNVVLAIYKPGWRLRPRPSGPDVGLPSTSSLSIKTRQ